MRNKPNEKQDGKLKKRLNDLIEPLYAVETKPDGNTITLHEEENKGKHATLAEIRLNIKNVSEFAVYKFDQSIHCNGLKLETYAPFLCQGKARSMCDFIIFFQQKNEDGKIHAWVVNLKSKNNSNNISQMRAGKRLCEFLLGKLDDILKIQNTPEFLDYGQIDYVLFSLQESSSRKAGTNPLSSEIEKAKNGSGSGDGDGSTPENYWQVKGAAQRLEPLGR